MIPLYTTSHADIEGAGRATWGFQLMLVPEANYGVDAQRILPIKTYDNLPIVVDMFTELEYKKRGLLRRAIGYMYIDDMTVDEGKLYMKQGIADGDYLLEGDKLGLTKEEQLILRHVFCQRDFDLFAFNYFFEDESIEINSMTLDAIPTELIHRITFP